MKSHAPRNILNPGRTTYFISARTYAGLSYLTGDKRKELFKRILFEKSKKFQAVLKHWIIMDNHYHVLSEFERGEILTNFVRELHGSSSNAFNKLKPETVTPGGQVILFPLTPIEERIEKRVSFLWRRLKSTISLNALADFSPREENEIADFSPRPANEIANFSSRNNNEIANFNAHLLPNAIADFSPRLIQEMQTLNFSTATQSKIKNLSKYILKALRSNDFSLFSTLVTSCFPSIPIWYKYTSRIIRNERDFFMHFNYITQNAVKHNIVKNPFEYKFSGTHDYSKEYVLGSLRKYPIIDFGGIWK